MEEDIITIKKSLGELEALQEELDELVTKYYQVLYRYRKYQGGKTFEFVRGRDEQRWKMQ